ncbi:MAG: phosphate signaling complex protein PhoU [Acidobacteria bacterium]|nr:phosphate signaling complex protein PhoU [Acidobacteriota bacterium]MBI3655008.1 phosphate signaling complex protein PhoU [Acidobacteriota bacterium]
MARETFQKELDALQEQMLAMGEMTRLAIERSVETLKNRDCEAARAVIHNDKLINHKRWQIEEECLTLIATQQPVARDLRIIAAILNVIVDLERIGDHAEGIAKITLLIGGHSHPSPSHDILKMAQKATDMLTRALQSFVKRDVVEAHAICREDDAVDALYEKVYHALLQIMIKDPLMIDVGTYLMWASHNLERIADRVTNICERTVFLVAGRMEDVNISKY